nr:PDZ domain-containing protein [Oscillospiraceae bacterium]MBQ8245490.1 PDZ domain-containing protein [Oscillospiraceae bacterium]
MKKFRMVFCVLILYIFTVSVSAAEYLIPGGQVIGLELQDNTVTVASFHEELGASAKKAGLQEGDRILRINDKTVSCTADVRDALKEETGKVRVCVMRNGKTKQLSIQTVATEEGPKLGVYLKQGTTGVGTVTYYDPEKSTFAALGHGVNTKNGSLLQLRSGSIYSARVQSVKKGAVGTPGQLMGQLTNRDALGSICKNTAQGVFGKLATSVSAAPLPIAEPSEV